MILVTTEYISDKKLETLGLVKGSVVQSVHIGRDFMAGLKTIVGGEIKEYEDMMETARTKATQYMIKEAESLGADGIVGIRFTTSSVMQSASELIAYGTAVRFL